MEGVDVLQHLSFVELRFVLRRIGLEQTDVRLEGKTRVRDARVAEETATAGGGGQPPAVASKKRRKTATAGGGGQPPAAA